MGATASIMSKQPAWRRALYGYLALARISNSPTIVSNVLAGAALAGAIRPDGRVGLIALAMVLFYTAGMYLNDLLDYAIDCRERPERPLPSGLVSRQAALLIVLALFGAGSILLWSVGPLPFLSGLVLLLLIILYDRWHKSNPLSPLLMALCRAMVYVTAFLAFPGQPFSTLLFPCVLLFLYVTGLTYIAKTENKPNMANLTIVVTLFLPTVYFMLAPGWCWATVPLLLCFTLWTVYSISFSFRAPPRQIGRAVGMLIAGISLLDALQLAVAASFSGILLALLAFALTLFLQRYVRGT